MKPLKEVLRISIKPSSSARVSPFSVAPATTLATAAVYAVVRSAADLAIDHVTVSAPLILVSESPISFNVS